jgi:hypothetical protein
VNRYRRRGDPDPVSPTGRITLGDNEIAVLAPADLEINVTGGVAEDAT